MKEDIEQLRKLIRELDLAWLDEELDEIISAGRLQPKEIKEGRKKSFSGIEQIAYTEDEQLDIIISALRNYFVVLPKVEADAISTLFENLKISKVAFTEIDMSPFSLVDGNTQKLNSLLNQIKNQ